MFRRCVVPSCPLSLKWGLAGLVDGDSFLESVCVVCSGLSRGRVGLSASVADTFLAFDLVDPPHIEYLEFLLALADVSPALLEVFVRVSSVWDGKKLMARAFIQGHVDALDSIRGCIQHCMRWGDFSGTMWTKVGESGQMFLKSVLIDIDAISEIARNICALGKWRLNYFSPKLLSLFVFAQQWLLSVGGRLRLYYWI